MVVQLRKRSETETFQASIEFGALRFETSLFCLLLLLLSFLLILLHLPLLLSFAFFLLPPFLILLLLRSLFCILLLIIRLCQLLEVGCGRLILGAGSVQNALDLNSLLRTTTAHWGFTCRGLRKLGLRCWFQRFPTKWLGWLGLAEGRIGACWGGGRDLRVRGDKGKGKVALASSAADLGRGRLLFAAFRTLAAFHDNWGGRLLGRFRCTWHRSMGKRKWNGA